MVSSDSLATTRGLTRRAAQNRGHIPMWSRRTTTSLSVAASPHAAHWQFMSQEMAPRRALMLNGVFMSPATAQHVAPAAATATSGGE